MEQPGIGTLRFPDGFLWGTASSSHQVEGDNTNNQWWEFEQQPGAIWDGHRSGRACDWWRNAEADFDLMQRFGLNTHRLSLEWSRIEPRPGEFDHAALDRYRALVGGLRDRGIRPFVNLHHFTEPLWFSAKGGWVNGESIARYQAYARRAALALGDLCDDWMTFNEPTVLLAQGWFRAIWPPQDKNPLRALAAFRHLLLAHAAGYRTLHAVLPNPSVGYAAAVRLFQPSRPESELDRQAASLKRYLFEHIWIAGCADGRLRPPVGLGERHAGLAGSADYIGINYYTRDRVRFSPNPLKLFGEEHFSPGAELSDMARHGPYSEYWPQGLRQICNELRGLGKPVYITENGLPDADDDQRPRWLLGHLEQLHAAIAEGCDVRGYFHWTFTDNFEWAEGWNLRFGLVEVDPATQARRPRPSARLYEAIARANAITPEVAAAHAPQHL